MKSDRTRPTTFKSTHKSHEATKGSCLPPPSRLAFALPANELLDAAIRFVVGHLNRRMLGEKRRGGMQHPTDAPIERKVATTDGIDRHAG